MKVYSTMGIFGVFYHVFIILTLAEVSGSNRGCYFLKLDRSRLVTCVDERSGEIKDLSAWKTNHATLCSYRHADTLKRIECLDGQWVEGKHTLSSEEDDDLKKLGVLKQLRRRKKSLGEICRPGWWSIICCEHPGLIANGDVMVTNNYIYPTVNYSCHVGYNATSGSIERGCIGGTWTGEPLVCQYAYSCNSSPCMNKATCINIIEDFNCACEQGWTGKTCNIDADSCKSSPCMNKATCINLIDDFNCACEQGWTGKTCNIDIQPPVVRNCPSTIRTHATQRTVIVSWTEPLFSDPMGTELVLEMNYETPTYTFPWGDFTVHYSATKLRNGLRAECIFNISVRPTPCDPLSVPNHGALLCNAWSSDYGQVCLLACERNYAPSPPARYGTWMICGDDGRWSSKPTDCALHMKNETTILTYHTNYSDFVFENCMDYTRLRKIFLNEMMDSPDISELCRLYPGCEGNSSVLVYCCTSV